MGKKDRLVIKRSPSWGFLAYYFLVFYLAVNLMLIGIVADAIYWPLSSGSIFNSVILVLIFVHYYFMSKKLPPKYEFKPDGIIRTRQIIPGFYIFKKIYRYKDLDSVTLCGSYQHNWSDPPKVMLDIGGKGDSDRERGVKLIRSRGIRVSDVDDFFDFVDELKKNAGDPLPRSEIENMKYKRNKADHLSNLLIAGPMIPAPALLILSTIYMNIFKDVHWLMALLWSFMGIMIYTLGWMFYMLGLVFIILKTEGDFTTPSYYRLKKDKLETIFKKGTHRHYYPLEDLDIIKCWPRWKMVKLKDVTGSDERSGKTKAFVDKPMIFIFKDNDLDLFKDHMVLKKKEIRQEKRRNDIRWELAHRVAKGRLED